MGPDDVLNYWFGSADTELELLTKNAALWFAVKQDVDDEIRDTFGQLVAAAEAGELNDWRTSAKGAVALVIVLDQFTRNIHRGSGDAFKNDPQALEVCKQTIAYGLDEHLRLAERVFLYMPFMHSEELEDQERGVEVFSRLAEGLEGAAKERILNNVVYAKKHRDLVVRFGRFPHRNSLLGRAPTAEEEAYLAEGGETFGQKG